MSPRRRCSLHVSAAALAALLALGAVAAWYLTIDRNAWNSPRWPQFAGIHKGRVLVLSSIWTGGLSSDGWIYDALDFGNLGHIFPRYTRIGDTYAGTPPFNSLLFAASVPIWYAAIPLAVLSRHFVRRSRAIRASSNNLCPNCGYPREGLKTDACPECGAGERADP